MKKLLGIIALSFCMLTAYSQQQRKVEIFFDRGSYAINPEYMSNNESLRLLSDQLERLTADSMVTITKVAIDSYVSPEGDVYTNNKLSQNRTNAIYKHIQTLCSLPDSLIVVKSNGVVWDRLNAMVVESDMPNKAEVINLIENKPAEKWVKLEETDRWKTLIDSPNKQLMDLKGGIPYKYMEKNIFPKMRKATVAIIYFRTKAEPLIEKADVVETEVIETIKEQEPIVAEPKEAKEPKEAVDEKKPLFALKTNMLYDIAMIPTVEIEVPIGERWSVAGEWIFPWWITKDNGYALQMLSGQLEGKYWFGDRTNKPQLTGWFAGLYAGGGLYDLQWNGNGYQGEFYIAAGISAGYAHTINKSGSLRMEYSLGVGYLSTEYRYYEGMENNELLVWQHDGKYKWFGSTKAKVSLVWMLGRKGGKR